MHPYPFTYHRPASVDDALSLLTEYGDGGKLLAGGQSLLPVLKLRLAQPGHLIDITGIADLSGVRDLGDAVEIGALTSHRDVERDPILQAKVGLLSEIAHVIGDQQVRNRGTFGGALAHADTAADYPAGVLATGGTVIAQGPNGTREIDLDEFFLGFLTTALEPNEIVTAVRIPALPGGAGYRYEKMANPASGYAIVGVAAVVTLAGDGTIATARVGITGTSDRAYRPESVEAALIGIAPEDGAVKAAAASAADGVDVLGDIHAPVEYRTRITANLVRRAVLKAAERAKG